MPVTTEESDRPRRKWLHVLDLPQIYQQPSSEDLLQALHEVAESSTSFTYDDSQDDFMTKSPGIPGYLTSIVSSSLQWIASEDVREQIWDLASMRLSERSGRSAAPSQTRAFAVTSDVRVHLHEPSLTGDNLGFKTWGSSLLMSKRLLDLRQYIEAEVFNVLELGAGTGLVGISAACLWGVSVTLTDLPDIIPNLALNLQLNADLVASRHGITRAQALDWAGASQLPNAESEKYTVIVAADPIYSAAHPAMLAATVQSRLKDDNSARLMIELPLREHYQAERTELAALLTEGGLSLMAEGTETGYDDWLDRNGSPMRIQCWWGVWHRSFKVA